MRKTKITYYIAGIITGMIISSIGMGIRTKWDKIIEGTDITIRKVESMSLGEDLYEIKNLDDSKEYEVEVYAKEYNYGNEEKRYDISKTVVTSQDGLIAVGCNLDNVSELSVGVNGSYKTAEFDYFKEGCGVAYSYFDEKKVVNMGEDIPLVVYSLGREDEIVESIDLDNGLNLGTNADDLVIYVNIIEKK